MKATYDPSKAGRTAFISASGKQLEKKYIYATPLEWDNLHSLAKLIGQPVGQMLLTLAFNELRRLRDYEMVIQPHLAHASHR